MNGYTHRIGIIVTIEMVYCSIFVLKELASADASELLVPDATTAPRLELWFR